MQRQLLRRSAYALSLIAALLCSASQQIIHATPQASDDVDVFGYYSLVGNIPKAFSSIDVLLLSTIDDNAKKAPLNGFIRPKGKGGKGWDYYLVNPTLKGDELSFTTKTVRGVSYEFKGKFTKLGNFPETRPEGEVLLKGHLIKFQAGAKVAEADVSFSYSAGD